jgi:hypothetical protein
MSSSRDGLKGEAVDNLSAIMVVSHRTGHDQPPTEGLISAQYWTSIADPGLRLALYDTERLGEAGQDRYRRPADWATDAAGDAGATDAPGDAVYECGQLCPGALVAPEQTGFLYLIRLRVDPAAEAEWNRWYNEEHVPCLAAVTGVVCARRFRARQPDAGGRNYLAAYHLISPEIPSGGEWKGASDSAWSRRMKPHHQPGKILTMFARADPESRF